MNTEPVVEGLLILGALAVFVAAIVGITTVSWYVVRLGTAPGVAVHECAHMLACSVVGVPVLEVKYFGFGTPAGYVRHVEPERYRELFVIGVAPFVVNTAVAVTIFFWLAIFVDATGDVWASSETLVAALGMGWLGLSVGVHAFPSTGDATALWDRARAEWRRSPIVLLGVPVIAVIYLANALAWAWADVFYALGLGIAVFLFVGIQLPFL
ncbi:metalloprotease family protein [Natrinema sp. SYSU A 869]|uniref:metalloprotease family protein n=1 Tax=Natrinema sp. SYSU A 869 TaxID=2871694 RepID=UPI001CA3AD67|nr:metalloprotease family protein [Natrinema sp. SYSU A 869]